MIYFTTVIKRRTHFLTSGIYNLRPVSDEPVQGLSVDIVSRPRSRVDERRYLLVISLTQQSDRTKVSKLLSQDRCGMYTVFTPLAYVRAGCTEEGCEGLTFLIEVLALTFLSPLLLLGGRVF